MKNRPSVVNNNKPMILPDFDNTKKFLYHIINEVFEKEKISILISSHLHRNNAKTFNSYEAQKLITKLSYSVISYLSDRYIDELLIFFKEGPVNNKNKYILKFVISIVSRRIESMVAMIYEIEVPTFNLE